jgi:hypothetical protein
MDKLLDCPYNKIKVLGYDMWAKGLIYLFIYLYYFAIW